MSAALALQQEDAQASSLAGIGVFMQQDINDSRVFVKTVVPYGPAGLDGRLQVGDIILSVDGESVVGMPVSMIRQRILGVAGSFVTLSFLSHSSSKEYTVKLIRGSNDLGIHRSTPPLQSSFMDLPIIDTDRTRQILEDRRREWDLERSSLERLLMVERDARREEQSNRRELERSLAASQEEIFKFKSNMNDLKDRENSNQDILDDKVCLGLFFQEEKKELIVRNIVPGSSAAANGRIRPGDIIYSVDGKSVEGQGIESLRDCILGDIGTFVELSFIRPARLQTEAPSFFSVTIERKSSVSKNGVHVSDLTFEKADLYDEDASDLLGEWYVASCSFFEDGSVYVHFVGFPINCDFWIPESDVSKRVRKHVDGTPIGPHREGSASWTPNQDLFGDHFLPVNSAVGHLRHQEGLLIASVTQDVAVLRDRLSEHVAALDNFNDARSQLERLRIDLRSFEQNRLASTHREAAEIKTATLHEMRQVSNARKPFVEAYARHVPPSEIVAKTHMEACLVRKNDALARVEELRLQLARAEEELQSTLAEEESLTQELCSLNEISVSFAKRVFEEEAASEAGAAEAIEERFRVLDNQIKLQQSECRALDSVIDDALHTVQTLQQSWQHTVSTKKDSEIDSRDVRLLFEFLSIEVSADLIASNAVDGMVLRTLSAETICKKLGICSFKDRLVLLHLQSCIKNATLESCVFDVSHSPLFWNVLQVETWLLEQSLPLVADAFKAEQINGMALLQLDDVLLQHFKVCESSLKHSQEVLSAIQRLRSTSQKPKNPATSGIFQILHSEITDIPRAPVMRGGSGSVQKVKYQGVDAAKKQPHLARALNDRDRGKFLKELEIAHKARHSCVVSMFGACFEEDGMFLLMEWMEGGSLYDALGNHQTKPIVARKRISIAREISGGLAYLHRCGIVHRDIKSLNVLLTSDCHAKLCDFGLATLHTLTTTASSALEGRQAGTLPWMAPEVVLLGSKCNASTDIYSFGVIMYELMTCEVPFEGLNQVQIEAQLKNGLRPQLPDVIPNGFPPKYVELMMSCWHQDPSQRPSSQQLQASLIAMDVSAQVNGPIELYPKGHAVASSATLLSILQTAMPDPLSQPLISRIVTAVRDVFSQAPNFIDRSRSYNLSELEAHCLCTYTLDARQFNGTREASPFFLYNAALRSRDASLVARWSDFSYVFEAALKKLPDNDCTVYRGLDCPLTEVSHLYEKGKLVWFNSVTSCTMDQQGTMSTFGTGAGGSAGTFVELRVFDAKDVRQFSPYPEEELLVPMNSCFSVEYSLSSSDAAMLSRFGSLPPNVDLVVLHQICKQDSLAFEA